MRRMGEEGDLGRGRGRNLRQSPGRGQSGEKPLTGNSRQPGTRGAARRGNPGMGRRGSRWGGRSRVRATASTAGAAHFAVDPLRSRIHYYTVPEMKGEQGRGG